MLTQFCFRCQRQRPRSSWKAVAIVFGSIAVHMLVPWIFLFFSQDSWGIGMNSFSNSIRGNKPWGSGRGKIKWLTNTSLRGEPASFHQFAPRKFLLNECEWPSTRPRVGNKWVHCPRSGGAKNVGDLFQTLQSAWRALIGTYWILPGFTGFHRFLSARAWNGCSFSSSMSSCFLLPSTPVERIISRCCWGFSFSYPADMAWHNGWKTHSFQVILVRGSY